MNTAATPTVLSDPAIKFLTKVSKRMKGVVHIPSLLEIAPLLGWTVTRTFIPRAGYTRDVAQAMDAAVMAAGGRSYGLDGSYFREFENPRVHTYTDEIPGVAEAIIAALSALGTVLPKKALPPAQCDREGVVFLRDVAVPKDCDRNVDALVWTSAAGYLVECDGAVLGVVFPAINRFKDGRVEESDEADNAGPVWTWAYKAGADKRAAEAIVALGDEATRRRRPEHPAGDEHTGICQICERRQKLKPGYGAEFGFPTLVDHGYHHEHTGKGMRDGGWGSHGYLGQRQNSCWGVGYQPWEIDSSRLRWFRDNIVEPGVLRLREYVRRLNAGEVKSITVQETEGYGYDRKVTLVTYTTESTAWPKHSSIRSWKDLLAREIADIEYELKLSEHDLARINARLDGWKRTPLYDELHPATTESSS